MENNGLTVEQYKLQVLKQNFARRITDYEDAIATLQTQLQIATQQIAELKSALEAAGVEELPVEAAELVAAANVASDPTVPTAE